MRFEVLHPPGDAATADELCAAMAPWERARADRPFVVSNMVASLDGHIAIDGGSSALGGAGDKALFHGLRCVFDAVLAGTGTVRAENYGRVVRAPERRAVREALGLAPDPPLLMITRSGAVPWESRVFAEPEQIVGIAGPPGALTVPDGVAAQVEVVELEDPAPGAALAGLAARLGLRSVLCEGGPTLNAGLLADGALDELFVTFDPSLQDGRADDRRLVGELAAPARLELLTVLRADHELLLRYAIV